MPIYGSNFNYGDSPLYKDDGGEIILQGTVFRYLPNWNYPVQLSYKFETIISMTRLFYEQRKALRLLSVRKHIFTITENDNYETIWNYFVRRHASSFLVPIFTEPLKISGTGSLVGATSLIVNNFEFYYNLRNLTSYCLLVDLRENNLKSELVILTNLINNVEIRCSAVVDNFLREYTWVFPVFRAFLSSKTRQDITDNMTQMDFEFTEIREDT